MIEIYGSFELLSPDDEQVFAYYRADQTILVILNFSEEPVTYTPTKDLTKADMIRSTEGGSIEQVGDRVHLQPYSGGVWAL